MADEVFATRLFSKLKKDGFGELAKASYRYCRRLIVTETNLGWEYQKHQYRKQSANETDADPFKIIWIDPNSIRYTTGKIIFNQSPDIPRLQTLEPNFTGVSIEEFGAVKQGDWDIKNDEFGELIEYKSIKQRYENGIPWEETELFKRGMKLIKSHGKSYKYASSKEELLEKLKYYEYLLIDIKENGFKTQREQKKIKPHKEVTVNIGRNGSFLFNDGGRHRLSIAKVLGLSEIPVVVKVRQ